MTASDRSSRESQTSATPPAGTSARSLQGASAQSLAGVRVVDLSRVLAGPYATMLLADLGAVVDKVEHPTGDSTRAWGPPYTGSHATYYLATNRGKRSIVLDFEQPADLEVARRLVRKADVVVENFLTGKLERYGLDYASTATAAPGVIYCTLSGYGGGQQGGAKPGYDFLAQAEGGLMSITGPESGEPTKVGVAVSDMFAGLHAVIGILAALRHRQQTGQGQHVEVNLLSSTLATLANQGQAALDGGASPRPLGNAHPSVVPYETFATADDPIAVAVGTDGQFRALCQALERPDLAQDARFATNRGRVEHREALVPVLREVFAGAPSATWLERLGEHLVPCGRVNTVEQAFELAAELGLTPTVDMRMADGTATRQIANPVRLSDTPPRLDLAPPLLDEHAEIVRKEAYGDGAEPASPTRQPRRQQEP